MSNKPTQTLCWGCANACGKCAWSRSFQPVPGWNAEPTVVYTTARAGVERYVDSFNVVSCPEFVPD